MKLMHVITGLGAGGAEGFLVRLIGATRANHSVVVVSLMDQGVHGRAIKGMGVPVYTLGLGRGLPNPLALWRLVSLIRSEKPDVIISWMYHANFLAGLASLIVPGVPQIWTIHHANFDPLLNKLRTLKIARWCAPLSRRCAAIVYVAEKSRRIHEGLGYDSAHAVVIPVGVDGDVFQPDRDARERCRREWGIGASDFVFGLLARADPLKNQRGFLVAAGLAARANPALQFVLAGKDVDACNRELMDLVKSNGLDGRVRFLGHRSDTAVFINGLDAMVLSSLGESFPTVLCEALCCGKPCISTDVGDAAIIIGPHGHIVPPGDDPALADAMISLAGLSDEERMTLYSGARARAVGLFEMRRVAEQYNELIRAFDTHGDRPMTRLHE